MAKRNIAAKQTRASSYTPEEIAEIKQFLEAERARLAKRLDMSEDALQPHRQAGEESADVGSDNFIRDTGYTLMAEDAKNVRMIDESLYKLAHGKFGICADCSKIIGIARLRAKPYAKYCVDCKEKREKYGNNLPDNN